MLFQERRIMSRKRSIYLAIILLALCILLQFAIYKELIGSSPFNALSGVFLGFSIVSVIRAFGYKK